MKQILAITRRETSAFFHSAMAPVVLSGFLVLAGLFFTLFAWAYVENCLVALRSGREGYLNLTEGIFQPLVADMTIFLLFLLPAVTMRLLSSELRSGRFDLIMSWPVPERAWVLGKWLSTMIVASSLVLASAAYFGVVALLGKPEVGPVLVAVLGLLLLSGAVAAWGLVFSGLFPYQVIAYFLSFAFSLALFMVGALEPHLPGILGRLMGELSLSNHFLRFSRGVLDSRDIVYFVGLTVVGLAAAVAVFAGHKQSRGRRLRGWGPALALMVVAVFVQLVAARRPLVADVTPDNRYSLAPQTLQVLEAIGDDVLVTAFYQRIDPARAGLEVLLQSLCDRTPRVKHRFVDPEREPDLLKEYDVNVARTVVVESGGRRQGLLEPDEGQLINMIYRLATGARPVVAYVLGHGEHLFAGEQRSSYSAVVRLLEGNGYDLRPLVLPERAEVPANIDLVIMAGPKLDPSPAELAALDAHLARGGAMLALFDPTTPEALRTWARRYNIILEGDVIVSPGREGELVGVGLRTVVVADAKSYGEHPIVRDMKDIATIFPLTQSLHPVQKQVPGLKGVIILFAGPETWGERDADTKFAGTPAYDPAQDLRGPLPIGVALEIDPADSTASRQGTGPRREAAPALSVPGAAAQREIERARTQAQAQSLFAPPQRGRLVIVGNSEFASNANLELYGNRDLFLNMMNWLVQEEVLINLRARPRSFQPLTLGDDRRALLGWVCVLGWPLVVGGGSLAWVLRHRRRR
jgi:ABC-type uncharacterized transport system involved in gliding motility auxiliary subunit